MPSAFPSAPRLLKGAIVAVDPDRAVPSVVIFQYNPATLTRKLVPQSASDSGARTEAQRLTGAPVETINLEIELDATDGLEEGDSNTVTMGIHPQLAALEVLLYPKSADVITNASLLASGTIEIAPAEGPFTLFVWGKRRVVPVRITELSVNEEDFDASLNPIRAKIQLGLRVLSYNDLSSSHAGYSLFLSHQVLKETMAAVATVNSLDATGAGTLDLG